MKHVLIFGASIVHGVGGEHGGWADRLKTSLHTDMYGPGGAGEQTQVYELGIPGESLEDVQERFEAELHARTRGQGKPDNTFIVFSAGANNSIAVDDPRAYIATPDDYAATVHAFIHLAKDYTGNILGVGFSPVDESRTTPIHDPGRDVYFFNERLKIFEDALRRTCDAEGAYFVPLFGQAPQDWQREYLSADGLHPNDAGHEWIRSQVEPKLREMLGLGQSLA
jgi:lysophospholipase L1-like esterase